MTTCAACGHEAPDHSRVCPACARPLTADIPAASVAAVAPTAGDLATPVPGEDPTPPAPASPASAGTLPAAGSADDPRFVPGTVLADRYRLAVAAFTALFVFLGLPSSHAAIWAATYGITYAAVGVFMIRFGLVSFMAAFFFGGELLRGQPLTLDLSTWYSGSTLVALAAGVAALLFAFRTSLGDRKLLPESE